jgi:hypothetical protein
MPNVLMNISQYNGNCIFFCEPIKNNIMTDGDFIRVLYSTPHMTLNGVHLILPFTVTGMTSKYYNKSKHTIELTPVELTQIRVIEMDILRKLNTHNKHPQFNIYEHLLSGCVKITGSLASGNQEKEKEKEKQNMIVLKMSGVWETEMECGITYKFFNI